MFRTALLRGLEFLISRVSSCGHDFSFNIGCYSTLAPTITFLCTDVWVNLATVNHFPVFTLYIRDSTLGNIESGIFRYPLIGRSARWGSYENIYNIPFLGISFLMHNSIGILITAKYSCNGKLYWNGGSMYYFVENFPSNASLCQSVL